MALDVVAVQTDTLAPLPARERAVGRHGMGYIWELDSPHQVTIRIDHLLYRGADLSAEFEVELGGEHFHQSRHVLTSTGSRDELVRVLTRRSKAVDWDRLLVRFCAAVLRAERQGEPMQYIGDQPLRRPRYLVDELVQEGKPNLLFGPGGAGKGYLAVASCVAVALGRGIGRLTVQKATPVYFDWEDDAETMNNRVRRVCNGLGVDPVRIAYKRMKGLAVDRVNEMARAIAEAKATYAVVDSVSASAGSPGRGESWDSIAHRLFDALDLMPSGVAGKAMTWQLIDHVTGDSAARGDIAGKAFGSIQKMNRARCAWEVRSEQDDGSSVVRTTLYHSKWNHTGRRKPIGLTLTFTDEAVVIEDGEVVHRNAQLADKLADYFAAHGRASTRAIELALREKEHSIRTTLNREKERFAKDEQGFWDLVRERAEESDELPW